MKKLIMIITNKNIDIVSMKYILYVILIFTITDIVIDYYQVGTIKKIGSPNKAQLKRALL